MVAGGAVVMVSSSLGSLKNLSPKYSQIVTRASDLKELSKMPHLHDDPMKNTAMVPCYSLTKAMLNRMTQLFASDPLLTSRKITINSVCPGWCRCALLFLSRIVIHLPACHTLPFRSLCLGCFSILRSPPCLSWCSWQAMHGHGVQHSVNFHSFQSLQSTSTQLVGNRIKP